MNAQRTAKRAPVTGFTLIELLVVITIIALLLAVAAPALFNGLQSSRLGGAGDRVLSSLSEAQQTAFAQNCAVEVRFYSHEGTMDSAPAYRSFQMFRVTNPPGANAERTTKFGSIVKLPDGVIISADSSLSPSLTGVSFNDANEDSGVPGATYSAVRFLPDGTCRKVADAGNSLAALQFLDLPSSFMTLLEDDGKSYTSAQLPKNFYTIQTDPFTGKSRSYRPGF